MRHTGVRAIRPAEPTVHLTAVLGVLLLLLALGVVLFTMRRSPLKDDVAWLL